MKYKLMWKKLKTNEVFFIYFYCMEDAQETSSILKDIPGIETSFILEVVSQEFA